MKNKERLEFALTAAKAAEDIILRYYQDPKLEVQLKADKSHVTEADRNAEQALRKLIQTHFPEDGIIGEEFGAEKGSSGFVWILDPIDGTQSFICGVPLFGTLIGVTYKDEPIIGVANFPALGECYYASKGNGAFWQTRRFPNPLQARVSDIKDPQHALYCVTSIVAFELAGRWDVWEKAQKMFKTFRGWGDCYGHMLVATGRAEIMLDPLMHIWDSAALYPIVTEAGGKFFDFKGKPDIAGGSAVSTNIMLYEKMLSLL